MINVWKPIPNFENYSINISGKVKNVVNGLLLKGHSPTLISNGIRRKVCNKVLLFELFNIVKSKVQDLNGEIWKVVEDSNNYAISNYGRVKSLSRIYQNNGKNT